MADAFKSTNPGVTTGADILAGYDANAGILDGAATQIENLGPGLMRVLKTNGGAGDAVQVAYSPDGVYSGFTASIAGLTVNLSNSLSQKNSLHLDTANGTVNLDPNATDTDRVDLLCIDISGESPVVAKVVGIAGLTEPVIAAVLPLVLCVVPAGATADNNVAFLVDLRRFTPETQNMPIPVDPNTRVAAMPIGANRVWAIGGKSETLDASAFDVQWQHGGGTIFVKPPTDYSGLATLMLPKDPGIGWNTRLVDVATALGDSDGPQVLLESRGGGSAPLINGGVAMTLDYQWVEATIHFDGTQYLVLPPAPLT